MGKDVFKEFPKYCNFRILTQKMDRYSSYYSSLVELRNQARSLNDDDTQHHFNLEDSVWNKYLELKKEHQKILEARGLLEGFQGWL